MDWDLGEIVAVVDVVTVEVEGGFFPLFGLEFFFPLDVDEVTLGDPNPPPLLAGVANANLDLDVE
jgi:hypothetical protein